MTGQAPPVAAVPASGGLAAMIGRPVTLAMPGAVLAPPPAAAAADPDASRPVTVTGLAVPWNVPATVNGFGDRIEFAPGSLEWTHPSRVKFLVDHADHAIGFATDLTDGPAGLVATLTIPGEELADPLTAAIVRQMQDKVRDALSVGVDVLAADQVAHDEPSGTFTYRVTAGRLLELSTCLLPKFDDARIASIAASHRHPERPLAMPTVVTASDVPNDPAPDPVPDPAPDPEPDGAAADRLEAHRATVTASRPAAVAAMRDRFGSLGAFAVAAARGQVPPEEVERIGFALGDVTTDGIPGLVPPNWVSGFADSLSAARPVISAFSSVPLPDTGMSMTWPVRTRTPPLTGLQATELTPVVRGNVTYTTTETPIETYAGASKVAVQAIERSNPSLASLLLEELTYDLGVNADSAFAADLAAKATGAPVTVTTVPLLNADLAGAAAEVWAASYGAFPNVFVVGMSAWEFLAGASDPDGRPIFPNLNGSNPVGTLSFTDLSGNVRGLTVVASPDIHAGTGLMAWSGAATSAWSPVRTMTADMPSDLSRDTAIYQYGTWAVRRPEAIVKIGFPAGTTAATESASSDKGKK